MLGVIERDSLIHNLIGHQVFIDLFVPSEVESQFIPI